MSFPGHSDADGDRLPAPTTPDDDGKTSRGPSTWIRGLRDLPQRLARQTAGSYNREIDGLRFFAIMIVVIGHLMERAVRFQDQGYRPGFADAAVTWMLKQPGSGVMLFFTISGFIIARQFIKQKQNPLTRQFLSRYFSRRLLRIEPPYILLLLTTFVLLATTGFVPPDSRKWNAGPDSLVESLLVSLLYSHSWYYGALPRLFPPGWSLEIEVQFYLVAPLLFAAYFAVKRAVLRHLVGVVILIAGGTIAVVAPSTASGVFLKYTLVWFFAYFWLGIVLADIHANSWDRYFGRISRRTPAIAGWTGFILFLLAGPLFNLDREAIVLRLPAIALMFWGALTTETSFSRFCARPWISFIGGACYSLYLTHVQPMQIFSKLTSEALDLQGNTLTFVVYAVTQLPVLLLTGIVFYTLVERPFMTPNWPATVRNWLARVTGLRSRAPLTRPAAEERI